jgi:Amt family ammonium transporter
MILWIGWFGFNGGSTFESAGSFFGEVMLNTQLAAAAGVLGALGTVYALTRSIDVGMAGNGAIAGLVGITAPSGFVEYWAAPIIGLVAGVIVVFGVLAIEKIVDDPVGAISAHGLAGIWGTLSVGIFGSPRLVLVDDGAAAGIWYGMFDGDVAFGATLGQFAVQAVAVAATFALVFGLSYAAFAAIKATIGLRVSEQDELAGLDIATHGMYGYPEQFIPQEEYPMNSVEPKVAGTPLAPPVATQGPTTSA